MAPSDWIELLIVAVICGVLPWMANRRGWKAHDDFYRRERDD